ncbi:MAG: hypothetical protein PVH89_01915 [Gammaproteobacteria bacterium]
MSKERKQSRSTRDTSEIFSDADFDADEFVDRMDSSLSDQTEFRTGWRRLERIREERLLRRELGELDYWEEFGEGDDGV